MRAEISRVPPSIAITSLPDPVAGPGWGGRARRLGLALLAGAGGMAIGPGAVAAEDAKIARGREVYVAEGCINCHSQYVRPRMPQDVLWWGPARPVPAVLADAPPLIGLRRQGPDLMNVGNRRSADWQRVHLTAPRSISPGSRMPAYAHLFRPSDERGPALVAYLGSLGTETLPARLEQIAAWTPSAAAMSRLFDPSGARKEFRQLCAACHGEEGRGDGPLTATLPKPPDFSRDTWRHVRGDDPARMVAVARIVKFGVPGTAMAGREYLDDDAVVSLARYVESRHR